MKFVDNRNVQCRIRRSTIKEQDVVLLGTINANKLACVANENGIGARHYNIPKEVYIPTEMHLTREMVAELLPILQEFVKPKESQI